MYVFSEELISKGISPREIIEFAETTAVTTKVVKEFIISRLLSENNALCAACKSGRPGKSIEHYSKADLSELLNIANSLSEFNDYVPTAIKSFPSEDYTASIVRLCNTNSVDELYEELLRHYSEFGYGECGKYLAFVWKGSLKGVSHTDSASLDGLYCIDRQLKTLTDNTEAFLRGAGANNVLLYGNSGCGKSTSVKALLNRYHKDGLRLVQLDKEQIPTLPELISELSSMPFRFIVFIDDLSFEENDGDYKPLKTALEGRVEGQADNVLFYATSNRFHIINETWASRVGDDIHASDTRNERMSLSERFGIRIHFISPSQTDYLKIVDSILRENGVEPTPEVRAEALKWEVYYNGKSGRTANQFVKAFLSGNLSK